MTIDSALRARLREMLEKATPGPWFDAYNKVHSRPLADEYDRLEAGIPGDAPDSAYGVLPETFVCVVETRAGDTPTERGQRDAALIAAAVNALPALLDALDDREAKLAASEKAREAAEQALSAAGLRCLDCERLVRGEEFDIADVFADRDAWRAKAEAWERVAMERNLFCAAYARGAAFELYPNCVSAVDMARRIETVLLHLPPPTLPTPAAEKDPNDG